VKSHYVEYLVPRISNDEFTCAIVKAVVSPKHISSEKGFFKRLMDAVTEWAKSTKRGRLAWEQSSKDFNIGDLSGVFQNGEFRDILKSHGIVRLEIETFVNTAERSTITYDTHLVDESQIEPEEDLVQ
jgi:hypothetical protein